MATSLSKPWSPSSLSDGVGTDRSSVAPVPSDAVACPAALRTTPKCSRPVPCYVHSRPRAAMDSAMGRREFSPSLDSMYMYKYRQTIPTATGSCAAAMRRPTVGGRRSSPSSSATSARTAALALCALAPFAGMSALAGQVPLHRTQKPHVRGHHRHRELLDR